MSRSPPAAAAAEEQSDLNKQKTKYKGPAHKKQAVKQAVEQQEAVNLIMPIRDTVAEHCC